MKPVHTPEQSTCPYTHLLGSQERTDERPAERSRSAVPQAGLKPSFAIQHLCALRQVASLPEASVPSSVEWACPPHRVEGDYMRGGRGRGRHRTCGRWLVFQFTDPQGPLRAERQVLD